MVILHRSIRQTFNTDALGFFVFFSIGKTSVTHMTVSQASHLLMHQPGHTMYSTVQQSSTHIQLLVYIYTLQSTLYNLHSTIYTLQSTLYNLHSTIYSTIYTLQSTLYNLHSTIYTLQSTLYNLHSTRRYTRV